MVKCKKSDRDVALYQDSTFLPGILLGMGSGPFLKDSF